MQELSKFLKILLANDLATTTLLMIFVHNKCVL